MTRCYNSSILLFLLFLFFLFLLKPENCYALQSHGAEEGLYVHQMAHILFMAALAYLYWHTRITADLVSKGWRYLRLFCIFFFCWNLVAFVGHCAGRALQPEDIINQGTWRVQLLLPLTKLKLFYYLAKMDHFFSVPAFFFLLLSLRTFYLDAKGGKES